MKHPNELDQQLDNLRTLQGSYNRIATAAEAYNVGKTELAQNITAKGVQASADETLPELAEKVAAISQETYEINGGEMYAKQLFGSLETPNYWNLYEVLANLLSDGRLVTYGGILLAEYHRGYDSLALAGAGSGGAYVVSDKDENGQFKMYTEDTTHVWATEFDGKGNRWVAYCFADEYHDFQITDTNTSPRSIFIGKKVGNIQCFVDGRISQIVVPDGNELNGFCSNNHSMNWNKTVVFKANTIDSGGTGWTTSVFKGGSIELLYLEVNTIVPPIAGGYDSLNFTTIILKIPTAPLTREPLVGLKSLKTFIIEIGDGKLPYLHTVNSNLSEVIINNVELLGGATINGSIKRLVLDYGVNDKSLLVNANILYNSSGWNTSLEVLDLKPGWCKPLIADQNTSLSEESIYTHILQRLKQDEPDCGDGVTITLGATNLEKLTSEESVALLDELTNTYGYTFA